MNKMIYPYQPRQSGMYPGNRSGIVTATLIGALASAAVKATVNAKKIKEESVTKEAAVKDVAKGVLQGAVATATVASIHDALWRPDRSVAGALTYGVMGIAGVYAIEKLSDRFAEEVQDA